MEAHKILQADLLDIIFDGKNKQYGAYSLRKRYDERIKKAMIVTFVTVALIIVGSVFATSNRSLEKGLDVEDITITTFTEVLPPPVIPPPPVKVTPPPELNTVKFVQPVVVNDDDVAPDDKIEDINDDQAISNTTVVSDNTMQIVQAPVEDKATNVIELPKGNDDADQIFHKVEVDAEFPGGITAWRRYLEKNLDANTPVENGAREGTYQVVVKFIVSMDGSISDVHAETSHGFGMEAEAIKIIKKGPKWTPALQNGKHVNAYRRQPVTFVVSEQ